MSDLISIIVPIYKVEKYLCKCIDSILSQTYKNLEIILVDDGSPDNCAQICDEYEKKDLRVKVIHKKNGGLSDARNAGIEVSTGKYIMFVDGDDYIDKDMVDKMYLTIKSDNTDMVLCNYEYVNASGRVSDIFRKELFGTDDNHVVIDEERFWKNYYHYDAVYYVVSWNKLYRKEIFDKIRFPKGKIHEDEYVLHQILQKCKNISCISDKLYFYVQRSGSIMASGADIKDVISMEAFEERIKYFRVKKKYEYFDATYQYGMTQLMNLHNSNIKLSKDEKRIYQYYYKRWKKVSVEILISKGQSLKTRFKMMVFLLGGIRLYKVLVKIYLFMKQLLLNNEKENNEK